MKESAGTTQCPVAWCGTALTFVISTGNPPERRGELNRLRKNSVLYQGTASTVP
jgi:hypothetical protein